MKQKAVIFDMDGVIADTNPYHANAFEVFLDKYHIPYSQVEFEQHMYGKHNSYIMRYFFGESLSNEDIRKLEEEKEGLFREIYADIARPVNGLPVFLESLQDHGFRLGVATSAPKANMDLVLDKLGIRHYFHSTLSSEHVTRHKPDPEVYLKSADVLHTSPQNCVVFEDSFSGITAGLHARMAVVGVLTSHTQEELPICCTYIKDYTEMDIEKVTSLLD